MKARTQRDSIGTVREVFQRVRASNDPDDWAVFADAAEEANRLEAAYFARAVALLLAYRHVDLEKLPLGEEGNRARYLNLALRRQLVEVLIDRRTKASSISSARRHSARARAWEQRHSALGRLRAGDAVRLRREAALHLFPRLLA